jgi:thymidine phosphorylase/ribose 1,5-bisphosphokinase
MDDDTGGRRQAIATAIAGELERQARDGAVRIDVEALDKYPSCAVVLITAEISCRAERLVRRGRESADQITARLARESAPVPPGVSPVIIDNSGLLAIGVTAFVMALRTIAAQE